MLTVLATAIVMNETLTVWYFIFSRLWEDIPGAAEKMPGWLGVMFSMVSLSIGTGLLAVLLPLVMAVVLIPSVRMFSYGP